MNLNKNKVIYLENISPRPNTELILTRLGYKKNVTLFTDSYFRNLQKIISHGISLCSPKAAYAIYKILKQDKNSMLLENGILLESTGIINLLKNSSDVVFMFCTVGENIVNIISNEIKTGNSDVALIYDSVASQTTDAGLTFLMDFINKIIKKDAKVLTKHRFSPGFSDFNIKYQQIIYNLLYLEHFNIKINEKYMLIPEKSVIGVCGIERITKSE